METAKIVKIGAVLEAVSFPKLAEGKLRFLQFTMGSEDEVRPIIEGVAEQMDISVDEVAIIAGGVRCAKALDMPFPAFAYTYERLARYPSILPAMQEYLDRGSTNG